MDYQDRDRRDIRDRDRNDYPQDSNKAQSNGPLMAPRSDLTLVELKMKQRREEEERIAHERKMAAQKKLQELEEKSKHKQQNMITSPGSSMEKDGDQNMDSMDSKKLDWNKGRDMKYDKYDKYDSRDMRDSYQDSYQRGGGTGSSVGGDFKKTSFQSNLPPRFQKSKMDYNQPKRSGPQSSSSSYQGPGGNDGNNASKMPFNQQYWMYSNSKQPSSQQQQSQGQGQSIQQQPPRRNMSSLSQSSSDDNHHNRRDSRGGPGHNRRKDSAEDEDHRDQMRYSGSGGTGISNKQDTGTIKLSSSNKNLAPGVQQISRSMSDSSDKLSDHQRSEKSTSREQLCWAESMENDKKYGNQDIGKNRRVSESSNMSDEHQPKHILQRQKPMEKKETPTKSEEIEKKSVLLENSPKSWADSVDQPDDKGSDAKLIMNSSGAAEITNKEDVKKNLESIPEKSDLKEKASKSDEVEKSGKDDRRSGDSGINKRAGSGSMGSGNRYESSSSNRGGRYSNSSYSRGGNNWNRRGGGGHMRRYPNDYTDSDYSDEEDSYRGSGSGRNKGPRKDNNISSRSGAGYSSQSSQNQTKEGFSPRGEPSRRGRGGSSSGIGGFRKNQNQSSSTHPPTMSNRYGPPSSKSPFGSNEEKSNEKSNVTPPKETAQQVSNSSATTITAPSTSQKQSTGGANNSASTAQSMSDDDRTKMKQKALSEGLINKSYKDNAKSHGNEKVEESLKTANSSQQQQKHSTPDNSDKDKSIEKTPETDDKKEKEDLDKSGYKGGKSSYQPQSNSRYNKGIGPKSVQKPGDVGRSESFKGSNSGGQKMGDRRSGGSNEGGGRSYRDQKDYRDSRDSKDYRDSRDSAKDPRGASSGSNKLPPRLAKQREPREHQGSRNQQPTAWEKLGSTGEQTQSLAHAQSQQSQQQHDDNKKTETQKQQILDGNSAPVSSMVFENSNYKTMAPPVSQSNLVQQQQSNKPQSQQRQPPSIQQKDGMGGNTINDMIMESQKEQMLTNALQNMTLNAKQTPDIDFDKFKFESELSQLTDDKTLKSMKTPVSGAQNMNVPKQNPQQQQSNIQQNSQMQHHSSNPQQVGQPSAGNLGLTKSAMYQNPNNNPNSTISPSDLSQKIASCKKVWEEQPAMPTVMEHQQSEEQINLTTSFVSQQHQQHLHQYAPAAHHHHPNLSPGPQGYSFGNNPNQQSGSNDQSSMEQHFNKSGGPDQGVDDQNTGYPSPGQHVQHQHPQNPQNAANLSLKAAEAFATNANVCKVKPTQQQIHQSGMGVSPPPQLPQNTLQQQTYYQPSQYQMPNAIPSPPAVVYNPQAAAATGLYTNHYPMDAARTNIAYHSHAAYGTGGSNSAMAYNFLQTAPSMQTGPTHDVYTNLSQFRATVQPPFNQNQQISNPNTVLIPSTSNSLMNAASVKSTQPIGAIGSKSSSNPPTASAQAPYAQQYMNLYQQPHHMQSSSYYTNSTGAQANPYYGGATGTATQNYSLQTASMFSGHGAPAPSSGPPHQQQMPTNFGSHNNFLGAMMNNLVAMNAQQYRGPPTAAAPGNSSSSGNNTSQTPHQQTGYMKQQSQSHMDPVSPANFFKNNV